MGLAVSGEPATSAENSGADEAEEVGEDDSIVHHTASIGDVEVCNTFCPLLLQKYSDDRLVLHL